LAVNLEPLFALSIPVGGCLALGNLGEVELQRTRVRDAGYGGKANAVSSIDGVGLRTGAGGELVTADSISRYIGCRT
jgi:hypothetical protein